MDIDRTVFGYNFNKPRGEEEELDDITSKLWTPQVVQGGKTGGWEPPQPPSKTWLRDMEIGTIFFAKDQGAPHPLAEEYTVIEFTESKNTTKLNFDDHRGQGNLWVDTSEFEKRFKLLDILGTKLD